MSDAVNKSNGGWECWVFGSCGHGVASSATAYLFKNTKGDQLGGELADTERLGVRPLKVGDPGFDSAIEEGTVKWAVTAEGDLYLMPKFVGGVELKHPVLTGGADVQAAGEAEIAGSDGSYFGIEINNNSGHYLPSPDSLEIGRSTFGDAGIDFPPIP